MLGLGIIFELPVLIFILSIFGIVTPKFLLKNFRYAMLIITVAAAIVTPTPDATTMLVFMAPMIVLYFVGVICVLCGRAEQTRESIGRRRGAVKCIACRNISVDDVSRQHARLVAIVACGHAATGSGCVSAARTVQRRGAFRNSVTPRAQRKGAACPVKPADSTARKLMTSRAKLVSFGPRPPASDAIHRTQDYIHRAAEELRMRRGRGQFSFADADRRRGDEKYHCQSCRDRARESFCC